MRHSLNVRAAALAAALGVAIAAGCDAPPELPTRRPAHDPCAARLHDIGGQLLLYYAAHATLPPSLDTMGERAASDADAYRCPASGLPYVYRPAGLILPRRGARLVLYDAPSAHDGGRWGITFESGTTPQTDVIWIRETDFQTLTAPPSR